MDQLDSQTIRWILAGVGAVIIACVYLWGRYQGRALDAMEQDGPGPRRQDPPPQPTKTDGGLAAAQDDPLLSFDGLEDNEYFSMGEPAPAVAEPPPRAEPASLPPLIQISIVADDGNHIDGIDLRDAFDDLRLVYGDMGIYHRYDREYRFPLFSVASLVEPGSFPITDMENFQCPGVVLFFQPPQVDDPVAVFDDLISTCHALAMRLDAMEWDEKRQPLTSDKIVRMRLRLQGA